MLIVLEGCDGTGKTSIAKLIQAVMLDAEIIHCTAETPNDFKFFSKLIDIGQYRNIILDRGMYGQFVYQSPEDRKLSHKQLRALELNMIRTGAKVVHVTAMQQTVEDRLNNRSEIPMHTVSVLLSRFDDLFEKSLMPVITVDTTNGLEIGGKF